MWFYKHYPFVIFAVFVLFFCIFVFFAISFVVNVFTFKTFKTFKTFWTLKKTLRVLRFYVFRLWILGFFVVPYPGHRDFFCYFSQKAGVWESSETDPAKVRDLGENKSSYQNFFLIVFTERNATKDEDIIEGSLHMKVEKWSPTPSPRVNVENLSTDRCINSIIITGSNIDPKGGRGSKSP